MIDAKAIDTMTQMLALISKHGKRAYAEVETDASREHRRRAWVVTCMLARFAEHAAKSDLCFLLADDTSRTDTEREIYYRTARQADRDFMRELSEFKKRAEQFEKEPVIGNSRTDNDIVLELETCILQVKNLQQMYTNSVVGAGIQVTKKQRALWETSQTANAERLASAKQQLDALQKLALTRGIVVSLNRYRTVIKYLPKPITKSSVAVTCYPI